MSDKSHHHHHSFSVSVPLKVGRTAPMFFLNFFLHSILFAGSALDSFQCLRSLLIVSFHVFFGLPRPRCPTTSKSVMLLTQPSFLFPPENGFRKVATVTRICINKIVAIFYIPSFTIFKRSYISYIIHVIYISSIYSQQQIVYVSCITIIHRVDVNHIFYIHV